MKVEACPQCGAPAGVAAKHCLYCKAEFVVASFADLQSIADAGVQKYVNAYRGAVRANPNDAEAHVSLGLCYLRLGLFDLAQKAFLTAAETAPECGDAYFWSACAATKGRRLKSIPLADVRKMEEYVNAALAVDFNHPSYIGFAALIKRDCYRLNGLRVEPPTEIEFLQKMTANRARDSKLNDLLGLVKTSDEEFVAQLRSVTS